MKGRPLAGLLRDMATFARQAQDFTGDAPLEVFLADIKSQFALMHALQFLGEAARLVSTEDRLRLPSIPWAQIIGMRNIIAHNYLGADPALLFDTVTNDIPPLITKLDAIIAELGSP